MTASKSHETSRRLALALMLPVLALTACDPQPNVQPTSTAIVETSDINANIESKTLPQVVEELMPRVAKSYLSTKNSQELPAEEIKGTEISPRTLPLVLTIQSGNPNIIVPLEKQFQVKDHVITDTIYESKNQVGPITTLQGTWNESEMFIFQVTTSAGQDQEIYAFPLFSGHVVQIEHPDKNQVELVFPKSEAEWYVRTDKKLIKYDNPAELKNKKIKNVEIQTYEKLYSKLRYNTPVTLRDSIPTPISINPPKVYNGYTIEVPPKLSPNKQEIVATLASQSDCINCNSEDNKPIKKQQIELQDNPQTAEQIDAYLNKVNHSFSQALGLPENAIFFTTDKQVTLNNSRQNYDLSVTTNNVQFGSFIYQLKGELAGWYLVVNQQNAPEKPLLTFNLGNIKEMLSEKNAVITANELNNRLSATKNEDFIDQLNKGVTQGTGGIEIGSFTIPNGADGIASRAEFNARLNQILIDQISRLSPSSKVTIYIHAQTVEGQEAVYKFDRFNHLAQSTSNTGSTASADLRGNIQGSIFWKNGALTGRYEQPGGSSNSNLDQTSSENISINAFLNSVNFGEIYLIQEN